MEPLSAAKGWTNVQENFSMSARATVSNRLNLFVAKGPLQARPRAAASRRFAPPADRPSYFIAEETGSTYNIAWNQVAVSNAKTRPGFEINNNKVVMRGGRRHPGR